MFKSKRKGVARGPEKVGTAAPRVDRRVDLSERVVGRRPEVRRPDDRRNRLCPRLHPRVAGPRLIVIIEDDPCGTGAVDVGRKARRCVRYLGGGAGVEQPDNVHVRGGEVPFREIDERRKVSRTRVVRVQVSGAARGSEEPVERRGAVVVPVEERRREIEKKRVQAPCERESAADRFGPEIPHASGREIEIVAVRDPEYDVRLVFEGGRRRGGRGGLADGLGSPEGPPGREGSEGFA